MKRSVQIIATFMLVLAMALPVAAKTELRLAFWGEAAAGAESMAQYQKAADRLAERYPDVEVVFEMTPSRDYETKLFTQVAAGSAPDVMIVRDMSTNAMVEHGMLRPLDTLISTDGFDISAFYPQVLDVYRRNGKLYAMTPSFTTLAILYNINHFEEAGLSRPDGEWDWSEFNDTARKLTRGVRDDGTYDRYGLFVNEWDGFWTPFIRQNGGDIFDESGNVILDSPQNIETMEFLADLKLNQEVSPPFEVAGAYGWWDGLFMQGKVSMVQLGAWTLGIYDDPNLRWAVTELPSQVKKSTLIYSAGWGISSQTQHPELAWELVKELVGDEAQLAQSEIPSKQSLAIDMIRDRRDDYPENVEAFIDSLAFGDMAPQTTNFSELYARINGQVWQILTGEKAPNAAMRDAATSVRALLAGN